MSAEILERLEQAEVLAFRRHLELKKEISDLSVVVHHSTNETLELRERLVPGLSRHPVRAYAPHFASAFAVTLASLALAIALGACK